MVVGGQKQNFLSNKGEKMRDKKSFTCKHGKVIWFCCKCNYGKNSHLDKPPEEIKDVVDQINQIFSVAIEDCFKERKNNEIN